MRALGHKDYFVSLGAATALGRIGAPPEPLVARLADDNNHAASRAEEALVALGTPAIPAVAAALRDNRPEIRRKAARILGLLGGPTAVEPLAAALRDKDSYVRDIATESLYDIGSPVVDAALVSRDDDVRRVVVEALTKCAAHRELVRVRRAADEAKVTAERNRPQFLRTPCDLSAHDWRALGPWGHHNECRRCGAGLELKTGIVWATVKDGSSVRIGYVEQLDGKRRPVR